jgi:hypothetical protein
MRCWHPSFVTYIVHQSMPCESGTHVNEPVHKAHDMPGHNDKSPEGQAWFVTGQLHEVPELLDAEVVVVVVVALLLDAVVAGGPPPLPPPPAPPPPAPPP